MGGAGGRTFGPGRPRGRADDPPLLAEAGKRGAAPFAAAAEGTASAPAPPAGAARTAAPPRGGRLHGQALRGTAVAGLAGRAAPGHQVGEAAAVGGLGVAVAGGSAVLRLAPSPSFPRSRFRTEAGRMVCRRLCSGLSGRLRGCAEGRALAAAPRSLAAAAPRSPLRRQGWGLSSTFITGYRRSVCVPKAELNFGS